MSIRLWILLVLLSMLWGGGLVIGKYALTYFDPVTLTALRMGIAMPVLWLAVAAMRKPLPRQPRLWGKLAVLGAVNTALPFFLLNWAQQFIDSSMTAVLNGATPLFGAVLAHFLIMGEQLTLVRVTGLAIGIGGVALLVGPSLGLDPAALAGQAAVLGAAFCYGSGSVLIKRLTGVSMTTAAAVQVTAAIVALLPFTLLTGGSPRMDAPPVAWAAITLMGVAGTALAYLIYFHLVRQAGATRATTVTLLIPVSATLLAALFLGERPGAGHFAAMAVVLLGVGLVIHGRWPVLPFSRRSRPPSG